MDSIILLVAMIAVFYFLIIRPENKRKKQAENMRNSLKKGERITTIGGLVGREVGRDAARDGHAAVVPARAADGDDERALPFLCVERKQE